MATMRSLGFSIFTRYDGSGVTAARRDIDGFNTSVNRSTSAMNSWNGRILLATKAIAVFGPALLPIAANLTAIAGAATAMGASVGVAMSAYGLAVKNAIDQTNAMAKAGKTLSASQKEFIASQTAFNKALSTFGSSFRDESLKAASATLRGMTNVLKGLEPVARALAPEVTKVAQAFEKWTTSPSFKNYVNLIKASAVPAFRDLVAAGKDVLNVLGDGFRAFLPHGTALAKSIRDGAAAMKEWSDNGGFQRFLQYVKENGPQVREFFSTLWDALKNIVAVMRELGPFALGLTTTILKLVAALPPEWIANIVKGFVAWKAAMLGLAIISTVVTAVRALAAAWFVLNLAFSASVIGLVVIAIAALVAGIVLLIMHWGTVSGALAAAWNATWSAMATAVQAVWTALQIAWNAFVTALQTAWTTVSTALVTAWNAVWTAMSTAVQAVWTALQAAWSAFITAMQTVWTTVSSALSAAWSAFWTGLQTAAQAIWTALQAAWSAFITALQAVWSAVSGALSAAWSAFWTGLQTAAQAIWTAMQAAWQAFINALQSIWQAVSSALQAAWSAFWTAIQTAAQAIWTALQTAWQTFLTAVQTAWTTFSTALTTAWQTFWTAIQTAAQTVWTAIQTAWTTFLTALTTVWTTFATAMQTAWETVWNAIRTAVEEVWNAIQELWDTFLNAITEAWETFSSAFEEAWETLWNTVRDVAEDLWNQITGVIEDAINGILSPINMLIDGFNAIASAVGLDIEIPNISVNFAAGGIVGGTPAFEAGGVVNFARGGVIPGYSPGKDTINAMLSKGEGVLVPEAVRGLGADFVNGANYHFSHGRGGKNVAFPGYAKGGCVGGSCGGGKSSAFEQFARGGCAGGGCGKSACGFAAGGIAAFGRDPRMKDGWGIDFFQGGGVVGAGDPDPPPVIGPGGIIIEQDDDGVSGGLDVPSPGDVASGVAGVLTGGIFGDAFGTSPLVLGFIGEAAIRAAFDAVMAALDAFGLGGPLGEILVGTARKLAEGAIQFLVDKDAEAKQEFESMAVAGAQSCQAWAPLATQAMGLAGLSASQLPAFLSLLCAESGGNPNAINNTDINAQNGIPSQGLMQVIPPTFTANHVAGTSNNILDPLANMAAAARYIMNRYGGVVPGSPYAEGTDSATPGMHLVGEEGPELVGMNGPEMAAFSGGQSVLPAAQTGQLLGGAPMGQPPAIGGLGAAGGGLVLPEKETQELLNKGGFEAISQAAQAMSEAVKQAWRDANSTSATLWGQMRDTTMSESAAKYGVDIPAAANLMKATSAAAWLDMGLQSATQWALMRDTTFTESELHQGTTMPLMATTMQTASNAAWLDMQTQSTLQATTMGTEAFVPMETHMGTTMVEASTTMNEGVSEAFTTMSEAIVAALDVAIPKMDEFIAKAQEAVEVTAELVAAVQEAQEAIAALGSMGGAVAGDLGAAGGDLAGAAGGGAAAGGAGGAMGGGLNIGTGYENGTPFSTRGLHPVGEAGPELVGLNGPELAMFATGTSVLPAGPTGALITVLDQVMVAIDQFIAIAQAAIARAKALTAAAKAAAAAMARGMGNGSCAMPNAPVTQGPNSTGVAASAGTHDGAGVYDFGTTDGGTLQFLRDNGWAAWARGNGDGMSPHIHAVCMNASGLSPQAAWQVQDYLGGGSGLGIPGGLARGTNSAMRGWSWVGEKGPELMWMHGGEKVMPHGDSVAATAASVRGGRGDCGCGGVNVEFNFNGPVSNGDDVRNAVNEAIPKLRSALQQKCGSRGN